MWSFGLLLVMLGYAVLYTGWMDFRTGGQGPTLADSLGWKRPNLPGMGKRAGTDMGDGTMTGRRVPQA